MADTAPSIPSQSDTTTKATPQVRGYHRIEDYAAIGDCHGCALVASDGGIDWCCLDRFDGDPLFCRILDASRGGFLSVRPTVAHTSARAYLPGTNILRTEFRTSAGLAVVTDFMPLGRKPEAAANDYVHVNAPGWLVRRIEVLQGSVDVEIVCRPSLDFARRDATFSRVGSDLVLEGGVRALRSDVVLTADDHCACGTATLHAGERRFVVVAPVMDRVTDETIDALFGVTKAYWREWIGYCRYRGPYPKAVERSALVLKLMTYPPTGACVAAFTTSLPEAIGGERNWDYRFCWIRDASLMLHALSSLGYSGEAEQFYRFLCRVLADGVDKLRVVYGVGCEREVDERTVDHLDGYLGSRPVRAGNAAQRQRQLDLYGYVLEGALIYSELGGVISEADHRAMAKVADFIVDRWDEPDAGLWEMRRRPGQFVHSKAACWLVFDRAIRLLGERAEWTALRERIWQELLQRGRDAADGHFLQSLVGQDPKAIDAATLQLCVMGLPVDLQTMQKTRLAVQRELGRGDFLLRYTGADGLPGQEGAFLVCSFWMVDALLAEGEVEAATRLFERLLGCANDVGLYAEQIDPQSEAFLGNFPQAFTHLGLLNTAVSLALFSKRGQPAVRGGYAERARKSVRATFGWRGVAAALLSTGRMRLFSSRASKLSMNTVRVPR